MSLSESELFYRFGAAILCGFLVGLQREYAHRRHQDEDGELIAGVRTFPIIVLLGAEVAMGSAQLKSALPFTGVVIVVTVLLAASHFWKARDRD